MKALSLLELTFAKLVKDDVNKNHYVKQYSKQGVIGFAFSILENIKSQKVKGEECSDD